MAARLYKTEAIILRRTAWREADALLTLYTPYHGKLRVMARGVRKTRSKVGGHVEPLNQASFLLAEGKTLDVVSQAETIESFMGLRQDLWRTTCALYAAELVDALTIERSESYPTYRLLQATLHWLAESADTAPALRYFELRLLTHLGYQPELHECVVCRSSLRPERNYFSDSGGGVVCPECRAEGGGVRALSLDALKVLRFLQSSALAQAQRLKMGPELSREVEQVLREHLRHVLEKEPKSVRMLDRLRREGAWRTGQES